MPDRNILKTCYNHNPDGAGIMWSDGNRVHIRKGFMDWNSFDNFLGDLSEQTDLKQAGVVMHFRITTHGGTKPQNCHPFAISNRISELKKQSIETDVGIAHNGVIPIKCIPKLSDTQTYILKRLYAIKKDYPKFYMNSYIMRQIEKEITSKMAFLTADGSIYTIGDFIEEEGILYSNSSYKERGYYSLGWWDIEGKYLTPIEGFITDCDGNLHESSSFEYWIDDRENVFEYDFETDSFIPLIDATAYNYSGLPFRYNEEEANYFEIWR